MRTIDLNGAWLLKEMSTGKDDIRDTLEDHNKDVDFPVGYLAVFFQNMAFVRGRD